jgi:hypothetical protein
MQFSAQKFHEDYYRIAIGMGEFYDELSYPYQGCTIPLARFSGRLNFVRWCLIPVDTQYGTHFMLPIWLLDFSRVCALLKVQYILSGGRASRA